MDDKVQSEVITRVLVENNLVNGKETVELVKIARHADGREIQICIPNRELDDLSNWIGEIEYTLKESRDILGLSISSHSASFISNVKIVSEQIGNGLKKRIVEQTKGKESLHKGKAENTILVPEWNVTGMKDNSEPRDPPVTTGRRRSNSPDDEVLYRVTFENGEIRLNELILSRPNFDSENEVVFNYLMTRPNEKILFFDIEEAIKRPLTKKLYDIVRALGFRKELRELFFPHISKTAIEFVNPITRSDFEKRHLRAPRLEVPK